MTTFDAATLAQIHAANPMQNTWVSANAGSGKTRVLTDRVARLLLHDTDPQRILCLTYTKAAAAEMQNRLFKRLGTWAMASDEKLRDDLQRLGEDPVFLTPEKLTQARTLFAAALETPGGLKIQTIHAFCDALLRRFPLEAGVAPQFNVLEERQATQLRAEIVEQLASGTDVAAVDALAQYFTGMDTDKLTEEIVKKRSGFLTPPKLSDFDVKEGVTIAQLHREIIEPFGAIIAQFVKLMEVGKPNDVKTAAKLKSVISGSTPNQEMRILENAFLNGKGAKSPFSAKTNIATLTTIPKTDPLYELQLQVANAIETRRTARLAINAFERTTALHTFATAFLRAYDKRKAFGALLDYDDLIHLSAQLLTQGAMAQWVLYRLDGGLDHILVDEAQDTSPAQWAVVDCLAREFTYGASANDRPRSLFVVGDEKQSIYSFQGADPVVFGEKKTEFGELLSHIDQNLADRQLLHSFRSAPPILNLVDAVFDGAAGAGMNDVKHIAFHDKKPGRVDLWPLVEKEPGPDTDAWYQPVDLPAPNEPKRKLAKHIAQNIHALLDSGQEIEVEGVRRPVKAGDILILVKGRKGVLFSAILKELKNRDLPVAGADRLNVGEELAVRDILSLLQFAAMADDDLSLAEAMRSPLLGFTEAELFSVAHGRKGTLWQSLRARTEFTSALDILNDMRKQVDFLRPYELIERLLIKHKGRENLLARLGLEIEDGVDELLSQAMQYESLETPTLTGFLHWFVSGKVEIKRDMGDTDQIRIMTVHGAKGLEAPIVILPDTYNSTKGNTDPITMAGDMAIWRATSGEGSAQQVAAEEQIKANTEAENLRLLYVAMTRAESWLIVCGAGEKPKKQTHKKWYDLVSDAMISGGAVDMDFAGIGVGLSLHNASWETLTLGGVTPAEGTSKTSMPEWMVTPAPKTPRPLQPIAPSKLAGAKALPNDNALPEEDAKRRGRHLHKLLEFMPNQPNETWDTYGETLLSGMPDAPDQAQAKDLVAEAITLLNNPDLHHIFFDSNSISEVGITAPLAPLGREMMGYIDRLIITESTILAVDFKSNAGIPPTIRQCPMGILAQQGAYLLALQQIYPDHVIDIAILWTRTGEIMSIPHNIAIDALNVPQHLDDLLDHS